MAASSSRGNEAVRRRPSLLTSAATGEPRGERSHFPFFSRGGARNRRDEKPPERVGAFPHISWARRLRVRRGAAGGGRDRVRRRRPLARAESGGAHLRAATVRGRGAGWHDPVSRFPIWQRL